MHLIVMCSRAFLSLALTFAVLASLAADFPAPQEGNWTARNLRFHTGEVMPEVTLHYRTIGSPSNEAVLVLHGTAGSGASMLTRNFAGELFGAGQPLDANRYFIILPDALGTGQSTRPSSSGLRMKFPKYNYDDMVQAQYRLVTDGEILQEGHRGAPAAAPSPQAGGMTISCRSRPFARTLRPGSVERPLSGKLAVNFIGRSPARNRT